jgi:hypothetical protein
MLTAALFTMQIHHALASPVHSFAVGSQNIAVQAACKYGSGKCADVKPEQKAPSTVKNGPQDPTVDPDCAHYGNCHGGNPEGGSASAKRGSTSGTKGSLPTSAKSSSSKSK